MSGLVLPTPSVAPACSDSLNGREARRRSYGVRSTTKISEPPALVSGPPPKSTVAANQPVVTTLPLPSMATAFPPSFAVPPKRRDQSWLPLVPASFATKISPEPAVASAPPPKLMLLSKLPVTATLPLPSTAIPVAFSNPGPVACVDHIHAPVVPAYFATKTSLFTLVYVPAPKFTAPLNCPVMIALLLASTATPVPRS